MKKATKIIALLLCAVLLVGASVAGTLAYLTSKDSVKNTFTVGNVKITLDETDTDNSNTSDTDCAEGRDKGNKYHLMPGKQFVKDPIVHVDATSESCWVFVKVENGLKDYLPVNNIENQITANGWAPLDGQTGVYYKSYIKGTTDKDLKVFETFTVKADLGLGADWTAAANKTIVVTAYAVQSAEVNTVTAAWDAVKNL